MHIYVFSTPTWAHEQITACCCSREAYTTTGYTPFLSFQVQDLQDSLQNLLQHGAVMDGPVKYSDQGEVTGTLCTAST